MPELSSESAVIDHNGISGTPGIYTRGYKAYVVGVLLLVYTSNFIDRTILSALAEPIKNDLHLADWQIGVLGGLSFAVFYSILGIPIARLSERHNRTWIISISVAIWSGMTALCGTAATYAQLLIYRVGVGVGEAGGTPPAQSIISDLYPPQNRSTVISIYMLGVPLGSLIGALIGGIVAEHWGWRAAFFVIGIPGLVLALIVATTVKEPSRGQSEGIMETGAPPALMHVLRSLWTKKSVRHVFAGITIASFVGYAMVAFTASYFIRSHAFSVAQAGIIAGIIGGGSAAAGTFLGGFLSDKFGKRDRRWYVWVPALGLAIAAPLYAIAYLSGDWRATAVLLIGPGIFHYMYLGPTYGIIQNMVGPRMRATAIAVLLLVVNLVGLGLGPPALGLLSDFLATQFLASGVENSITLKDCTPDLAICRQATANGLKFALAIFMALFAWASLHYHFASRRVNEDLLH
jgi:MFS family permease